MGLMVGIQLATIGLFERLVGFLCGQSMESKLNVSKVWRIGSKDALNSGIGCEGITTAIITPL